MIRAASEALKPPTTPPPSEQFGGPGSPARYSANHRRGHCYCWQEWGQQASLPRVRRCRGRQTSSRSSRCFPSLASTWVLTLTIEIHMPRAQCPAQIQDPPDTIHARCYLPFALCFLLMLFCCLCHCVRSPHPVPIPFVVSGASLL